MIKLFATILLICLVSVTMMSAYFINENAVHDCVGASCCTCSRLYSAQNLLRLMEVAIVIAFFKSFGLFAIYTIVRHVEHRVCLNTLFNLKVRYNN